MFIIKYYLNKVQVRKERQQAKEIKEEQEYQNGSRQYANRPYTFPKVRPPVE